MIAPRARGGAEKTTGKEQHDEQRHEGDDEGCELAGRPQELAGDDQEDCTQRSAQYGAPAAEDCGHDDVDADRDVDDGSD